MLTVIFLAALIVAFGHGDKALTFGLMIKSIRLLPVGSALLA